MRISQLPTSAYVRVRVGVKRAQRACVWLWHWLERRKNIALTLVGGLVVLALVAISYLLFIPPYGFPSGQVITITDDSSTAAIGAELQAAHVVRSGLQFHILTRLTGEQRGLQSGMYVFAKPIGLWSVAMRVAKGNHGIQELRVTLTEGMTAKDMAQAIAIADPGFDTKAFLSLASTSEGYLFPDTYFILPNVTPQEMFDRLTSRFAEQEATIDDQVVAYGKPLGQVVIMASILEREARGETDMRVVAGILWHRIALGMPLQVDAAFGYAHGENGYTPTAHDLETDSPYNTYLNKGLPPTPISNPGLDALMAAVTPTKTTYLYYLTGSDGEMHYATTFDQHKANRAKYLK